MSEQRTPPSSPLARVNSTSLFANSSAGTTACSVPNSKVPPVELYYFQTVRGRAERARLLMEVGGIPYVNKYVDGPTLQQLKAEKKLAFGQLPLLVDPNFKDATGNNLSMAQSMAQIRHLARRAGLYGNTPMEAALIDMIADGSSDLKGHLINIQFNVPGIDREKLLNEVIPTQLENFERLLISNDNGQSYFVGNRLSYADILVYDMLDDAVSKNADCLKHCPNLAAFKSRIEDLSAVKNYFASERRLKS